MEVSRSLTADERHRVEARRSAIAAALSHRDHDATARTVTAMMLAFPSGRATGEEAKAVVRAYCAVLSDVPPWAAERAAQAYLRGEADDANPAFAPSATQLRQRAAEAMAEPMAEAHRLTRLLDAHVTASPDAADTERRAKAVDELAAGGFGIDVSRRDARDAAAKGIARANDVFLARQANAAGVELDEWASPSLLKQLGGTAGKSASKEADEAAPAE